MTTPATPTTKQPSFKKGVYNEPKYLRPDHAATRLSVTTAFIYKLMSNGSLRFHKLGRTRLIKITDLDALVESPSI
jgi:excisionase family DNA binding protein